MKYYNMILTRKTSCVGGGKYLPSPLLLLKVKVSSAAIDCWPTEIVEGIFSYVAYRRQLLLLLYLLTIKLILKLCVPYLVTNLN